MHNLRVMTFNIRCHAWLPQYDEGENAWPCRAALNVATIRKQDPDLIAFQEFERHSHQATYDVEFADYDRFIGPEYGTANLHCHVPIYWKRGRLELVGAGGFWLSPTPSVYSLGWDGACVRAAAWVVLKDLQTGLEFLHVNTHLDHKGEHALVEGAQVVAAHALRLAPAGAAVLLTGDFNCKADSAPYRLFRDAGFADSFVEAGNTDVETFTYHGYKGTDPDKTWRIDWILARGLPAHVSATHCAIVRDAAPPLYPSDHFPVVADFAFAAPHSR